MANPIKYNTSAETLALKKGNFYIGTGDVGKGPTSSTGYYNGVTPPSGGFTIYLNKASDGPAIYTVSTEAQLTSLTNKIAGTSYTTSGECLTYFATQTDKLIVNRDYENIITNGLILNLDAAYVPSYPRNGSTWYDLSGGGHDANLYNGITYGLTSGVPSLICDGTNDWIGNTTLPGGHSNFTLELMFYHNGLDQGGSYGVISMGSNGNYGPMHYCHVDCTYGHYFPGSPSGDYPGYNISWNNLQWNIITWVYGNTTVDDNTGYHLCYVNGQYVTGNLAFNYHNGGMGRGTNGYGLSTYSNGGNPYKGSYSQFRVYNRALSASEILYNYNAQKARYGL